MSGVPGSAAARQKQGEGGDDDAPPSNRINFKGTFAKDLTPMMYGFGDDDNPLPETVNLVEDIVIEYASGVLRAALDISTRRGRVNAAGKPTGAPTADDIVAVVRKDPKKTLRAKELLYLVRDIEAQSRKLDTSKEELAKLVDK